MSQPFQASRFAKDSDAAPMIGLEGVVVAETELSMVDGAAGELVLAGYPVETLADGRPFEAVAHLLLWSRLPDAGELDTTRALFAAARRRAFERLRALGSALERSDAMDALRGAVALLDAPDDPYALVGAIPVFVAGHHRLRAGEPVVAPDATLGHAADYLRMLHGVTPSEEATCALDAYLSTVIDHGLNASTFAARVVASTESDLVSAVTAAIGALKGRLHGGAPGPVLDMLDAIGSADRAEHWLRAELAAGRRIMGMGHRVYRVRDPRAAVLERALRRLARDGASERLVLAHTVEQVAERLLAEKKPDRPLRANVEFYTAVLLEQLGIPRALFTATFAVGRVVGWAAHVAEQKRSGRLIRPSSRYVGRRLA